MTYVSYRQDANRAVLPGPIQNVGMEITIEGSNDSMRLAALPGYGIETPRQWKRVDRAISKQAKYIRQFMKDHK